jgi:hypothetical protein
MAIPTTIEELSTTAASNGPSGSDQRNTADDGLRAAYAFIRMLVTQGSDVASASSITPASTGSVYDITGTTAITALASTNSWDGRRVLLQFDGALTLTHSSNLALPGSANITTAAGDVAEFVQRGSGAWRCVNYQRADGTFDFAIVNGKAYTPTVSVAYSTTPTINAALGNVFEIGSLTGNITTLTISNASAGQTISIRVKQDGSGAHTVVAPTGAKVAGAVSSTASAASILTLTYSSADTRWEGAWTQLPV